MQTNAARVEPETSTLPSPLDSTISSKRPALASANNRHQRAEQLICRILCVKPKEKADMATVHRVFSISMVISGLRCLFSYVLAPFVAPAVGAFASPVFGIVLSCIAVVFDVRGMRRFWSVQHPQRWAMTALYSGVIIFVLVLLGSDVARLAR